MVVPVIRNLRSPARARQVPGRRGGNCLTWRRSAKRV